MDAHPEFSHWPDGTLMRNRILSYDSTFGLAPTAALTLHLSRFDAQGKFAETMTGTVPSRPAVSTFDDRNTYWFATDGHTTGPTAPTRVATSPVGTASTSPRPARRSRRQPVAKQGNQLNLQVN